MAKKRLNDGKTPFESVPHLDEDGEITVAQLKAKVPPGGNVSLCIRQKGSQKNWGGYFFHWKAEGDGVMVTDFEGHPLGHRSWAQLAALVNHASGRAFDEEAFEFCQEANFRTDEESKAKA